MYDFLISTLFYYYLDCFHIDYTIRIYVFYYWYIIYEIFRTISGWFYILPILIDSILLLSLPTPCDGSYGASPDLRTAVTRTLYQA
jgi:hypothetical protein